MLNSLNHKINRLSDLFQCSLCSKPMKVVGTTENGLQCCVSCIRNEAKQGRSEKIGNFNAAIVDQAWSKLSLLIWKIQNTVNQAENSGGKKRKASENESLPCKIKAVDDHTAVDVSELDISLDCTPPDQVECGEVSSMLDEGCTPPRESLESKLDVNEIASTPTSATITQYENDISDSTTNEMAMNNTDENAFLKNSSICDSLLECTTNANLPESMEDSNSKSTSPPTTKCTEKATINEFIDNKRPESIDYSYGGQSISPLTTEKTTIKDISDNKRPEFIECTYGGLLAQNVEKTPVLEENGKLENSIGMELEDNSECDSDNDSFVPPTPQTQKEVQVAKTCFMGTGLSKSGRIMLQKFAESFEIDVAEKLSPSANFLIVEQCGLTLKFLYARCRRIPIVKVSWMEACLTQGRILPYSPYLVEEPGFPIPQFFQELDVILCPPFSNYSYDDLKSVLKSTGARVSCLETWEPGPPDMKRIIVGDDETIPYDDEKLLCMCEEYRAPVVDISYFMAVLEVGELLNIQSYLILDMDSSKLVQFGFPVTIISPDRKEN